MGGERIGRKDVKEGRRIPSQVHLNPSCVSPPGPGGPALQGQDGGPQWRKGRRVEGVEGENELALTLFPGDRRS